MLCHTLCNAPMTASGRLRSGDRECLRSCRVRCVCKFEIAERLLKPLVAQAAPACLADTDGVVPAYTRRPGRSSERIVRTDGIPDRTGGPACQIRPVRPDAPCIREFHVALIIQRFVVHTPATVAWKASAGIDRQLGAVCADILV